ncbi:MAG TPA: AMP-binding protein [Mycobacteriales bacterium]|nr:AMP-binding protein [Mycobacteriales bacterium]
MVGTERNLADLVREAAARDRDARALVFRDTTVTWGELDDRVDAAAAALLDLGLVPGDRLALALPNGLDFPVLYFGALRAGLVALPVNPGYTAPELSHVLSDSGASALAGAPATVRQVAALGIPALRHLLVAGTAESGAVSIADLVTGGRGPVESGAGGEDLAVLMYTSGTSSRPKGAMLSHRAMLANLDQCGRIEPPVLAGDDVVLLVLPLFHIYGLAPGLGMVARAGCTGVLVERFDPVDTLALMQRHGITNVIGAPPMYMAWSLLPQFAEAFAGVRLAVSGAAPLDPEAQQRLLDATGHHVFEGYGLTETAPVLTSTLASEVAKPGSIGRPIPGVELELVDSSGEAFGTDDDEEIVLGDDEPGEIAVRGPNLFSGYWPDGAGGPDTDGWWRTGDVAYRDDDGDLFLVDRLRELVLVSGFNVYPREIEDVLFAHPDITEAAVIGVPHPYTGETVKAFVVPAAGAHLSVADVIAHCEGSLARFKCPTAVEFVDALPHSATGKVAKSRLRAES